jgi:hypothetical protein
MKGIVLLKRRRAASRSAVGVQDAGESEAADRLWIASGGAH